jgi:hypothetical protein
MDEPVNLLDESIRIARSSYQKPKVRFPLFRIRNATLSRFAIQINISRLDNGERLADAVGVIESAVVSSTGIRVLHIMFANLLHQM